MGAATNEINFHQRSSGSLVHYGRLADSEQVCVPVWVSVCVCVFECGKQETAQWQQVSRQEASLRSNASAAARAGSAVN